MNNALMPIYDKLVGGAELSIALIKMFMFSKLFVWHLSRRIVRLKRAGIGAASYRKEPSRDRVEND